MTFLRTPVLRISTLLALAQAGCASSPSTTTGSGGAGDICAMGGLGGADLGGAGGGLAGLGGAGGGLPTEITGALWTPSAACVEKAAALVEALTPAQRYGQMTQVDSNGLTVAEATSAQLGSVLSGGGSDPTPGNKISDCAASAVWWGPGYAGPSEMKIRGNLIDHCLQGVFIQSAFHNASNVEVGGNSIRECVDGVFVHTFTTGTLTALSISDNQISSAVAASVGIRVVTGDTTYKLVDLAITRNTIKAVATGIRAASITTGPVSVRDNTLVGAFTSDGLSVSGSTKAIVDGNRFCAQSATCGG